MTELRWITLDPIPLGLPDTRLSPQDAFQLRSLRQLFDMAQWLIVIGTATIQLSCFFDEKW